MNERIHRALDGELPRDMLTQEERAGLARYEAMIAATERAVERHDAPDLTEAVMSRIAQLPLPGRQPTGVRSAQSRTADAPAAESKPWGGFVRALEWLWAPRPIAVRPAWALGAAVLVLALFGVMPRGGEAPGQAPVVAAPAAAAPEIFVHFRLDAPDASSVHLAGDFTDWEPSYELHESQPGVWTVVVPLEAGVHDYAFVIDGQRWTPDPLATAVDDGFGGQNSRLSLLPPERMRV